MEFIDNSDKPRSNQELIKSIDAVQEELQNFSQVPYELLQRCNIITEDKLCRIILYFNH